MSTPRRILSTAASTNQGPFSAADWALFCAISLIWGASFLLMDIGLEAFRPGLITLLRVASGAALLWLIPAARRPLQRADRPRVVVLSFLWVALPFTIFPLAQQWVNSALTGMLNGAMPIFAALVATGLLRRMPRPVQLAGLLLGFVGVTAIAQSSASSWPPPAPCWPPAASVETGSVSRFARSCCRRLGSMPSSLTGAERCLR